MDRTFAFLLAIGIAAAVCLLLAIYERLWGFNLAAPSCPDCGTELRAIREPKSVKELVWGGWTCPTCGCHIDKWGLRISQ